MSNKSRITFIHKSVSLDSLHVLSTTDNYFLTSTTTQPITSKIPVNIQRMKATILIPKRPPVENKSSAMTDEQESSMTNKTDSQLTSQNNRDDLLRISPVVDEQYLETSLHQKYPTAHATNVVSTVAVNSQGHRRTSIVEDDFDTFILRNFVRFSGKQNVISWLDETEQKFREFRMGLSLRYKAILLLIEGAAKRAYLTHGKEIRSFDDFYEFLLSQFDMHSIDTNQPDCNYRVVNSQLSNLPTPFKPQSTDKSTSTDTNLGDSTELTLQTPALCSTPIVDISATNTLGEAHATTSVNSSNNLPAFDCDRTFTNLRKAIFADSIKNPKRFKGGNDVKELIKEVNHLLEVTKIPESTRLDLFPYSSRSYVFERFKTIDQAQSSFLTDEAREMFSAISYNRCNPLGHEATACSTL
jgi:hypothetical protein